MYEDVQTIWQYKNVATGKSDQKRLERLWNGSRDSSRTPVQWSAKKNAGFSKVDPWFYVNENYKEINVADQEKDPDSVLNFYRKAIALRKSLPAVKDGKYKEYFKSSKKFYTYSRKSADQKILVVCSFSDKMRKLKLPAGFDISTAEIALCNYNNPAPQKLRPYEARVYVWNK